MVGAMVLVVGAAVVEVVAGAAATVVVVVTGWDVEAVTGTELVVGPAVLVDAVEPVGATVEGVSGVTMVSVDAWIVVGGVFVTGVAAVERSLLWGAPVLVGAGCMASTGSRGRRRST